MKLRVPVLEDLPDPTGKRVLVRTDFNVPMTTHEDGSRTIDDDFRITQALSTLQWLLEQGAEVTVCTHLGRPKGVADPQYSVEPIRARLNILCPGLTLLENLRFHPGEEGNDPAFVAELIEGQDLFVNDAFGVLHRAHASVVGPPQFLPSAAGRLIASEVEVLSRLLADPARPFIGILGGAKIADKLGVMMALADQADTLVVGGGMSSTLLAALGHAIGDSLFDAESLDACKALLSSKAEVVLPVDQICCDRTSGEVITVERDVPDGFAALDIGPKSRALYAAIVATGKTVFWNGPMGVFEDPRFVAGTRAVADAVANCFGFTVVGGGDSAAAIDSFDLAGDVDYVSTGGGASLELMEYGDLPGLEALRHASNWIERHQSGRKGPDRGVASDN